MAVEWEVCLAIESEGYGYLRGTGLADWGFWVWLTEVGGCLLRLGGLAAWSSSSSTGCMGTAITGCMWAIDGCIKAIAGFRVGSNASCSWLYVKGYSWLYGKGYSWWHGKQGSCFGIYLDTWYLIDTFSKIWYLFGIYFVQKYLFLEKYIRPRVKSHPHGARLRLTKSICTICITLMGSIFGPYAYTFRGLNLLIQ